MPADDLLQTVVERFMDTVPSVWGRVRSNLRSNAICDFDLTLVQFHILRHIRHGAHSAAEIAERQQISRPAISQALDILVGKNLITRKQDSRDRRFVQLELTDYGNTLLNMVFSKTREWMGEKMNSLSPEEMNTILRAFAILKSTFVPPSC